MYFDPMYLLFAAPGMLLALWAQWKVKSTFAHYAQVPTQRGVNGQEAARQLMAAQGLRVGVERIPGQLTDHSTRETRRFASRTVRWRTRWRRWRSSRTS